MKFEEALEQFKMEIEKEYGLRDSIIKIGIDPELMNRVTSDLYSKSWGKIQFTPSQFGELILNQVQLLPRKRDNF